MNRKRIQIVLLLAVTLIATLSLVLSRQVSGQNGSTPSTAKGEWPMYTADVRSSKYSPLDQIISSNFNQLQVAWTFKTDGLSPTPEAKLEGTPIMVNGVVYATGGTRRAVVALDAKTGDQKWVYSQ